MRNKKSAFFSGLVLWTVFISAEQPIHAQSAATDSVSANRWNLPSGTAVKDDGPRAYRFTVDYYTANTQGEIVARQHVTGDYTRGLPGGQVVWNNVSQADAPGATAPFAAAQKREFMEGFQYFNNLANTFRPEFFKGFPPTAVLERNLVWDTGMIEDFGQNFFDKLKLNEPFHAPFSQDVDMPNVGTFHNRDVVLEWVGRSERNGQECAVINYQAFLNPLKIANGGIKLNGRSDYWGQIWVSIKTKQIEFASISESVVGELTLSGQDTAQIINVFRTGTLEPAVTK